MSVKEVIDRFFGKYRFLSNFFPAKVFLDGIEFPSVEHAYQAAKNFDTNRRLMFVNLTSAEAKREGQKTVKRPDWEEVKYGIMLNLVREKFTRNSDLKDKLLGTGSAELIEGNTFGDRVWGICKGVGKNLLGKILMQVREELNVSNNDQ
jgi:ribA/ribD-fused uncharacterized protein